MQFFRKTLLMLAILGTCNGQISAAAEFSVKGSLPAMNMPGKSFRGPLAPFNEGEMRLARRLQADVVHLAGKIGERNVYRYAKLIEAERFVQESLSKAGYKVLRQTYAVRGRDCTNLIVEIPGKKRPEEIVIVGGHYDSAPKTAGANDNGSGAAATLALARMMGGRRYDRTLRFVAFTNEEPPWFQTEQMGSLVYARRCKKLKENVVAMVSLETIGYYSDEKGSQKYPPLFSALYPSTGNFIGFIGDVESGPLAKFVTSSFRRHASFPSQGAAVPGSIPGVGWSDHWSFWQVGYRAVMVTDTAPFRYPHYHKAGDTPDKLDYQRMARVVKGVERVIVDLVKVKEAAPKKKFLFKK